jgi:KaiC/GvpD/RAD55 family RecA-like ATPase
MSKPKFQLVPAQRKKMKARVAVTGGSGFGKTYTALELATGFAGDSGQIAVLDSQHGQSCLYADLFDFHILELDTHSPDTYAEAITDIGEQGFDVLVVDSISLAWMGTDGALALVDKASKKFSGNTYAAWGEVTPMQNRMTDAIQAYPGHIIVTIRSKTDFDLEKGSDGKSKPVEKGMEPIQRDGFSYIMDLEIRMDATHTGEITKTRYHDIEQMEIDKPDRSLADYILERLNVGEDAGEPHWSDSYKKRQYLLSLLDKSEIPHEALFACYAVNNWAEMKAIPLPSDGSKGIVQKVAEFYASEG